MKLLLKLLGAMVALVLVVVIGAVVYIAKFFDPNDYKATIVAQVQEETGRSFAMNGPIGFSLYPWLTLKLEDVTLGNAPGFGEEPFFHVDLMQVRIKTMPLLREQIEMDRIQVHGLNANLAVNAEGRNNWADLAGEAEDEAAEPPNLGALAIGGVDIRNAAFSYTDATTGQRFRISNLNAETGELTVGDPITLALSLDAESAQPALKGDLKLDGTVAYDAGGTRFVLEPFTVVSNFAGPNVPGGKASMNYTARLEADLDADTLQISALKLTMLDTTVSGQLDVQRFQTETPAAQGSLGIQGADLVPLLRVAEQKALADDVARLKDRSFSVQVNLDADMKPGNVKLPTLSAKLLGATISGQVDAARVNTDTPAVTGALDASGPDLPLLIRLAGAMQEGKDKPLLEMGRKLGRGGQRDFSVKTRFNADMASGRVDLPALAIRGLGLTVDGNLKADNINKPGGAISGRLKVDGRKLGALLAALEQDGLGEVMQSLTLDTGLSGTMSDLALQPLSLVATLSGKDIPNSPVTLSVSGDARANMDKETASLKNFKVNGLGLDLKGNLSASGIKSKPAFQGDLAIAPFNLRRFLVSLKQDIPKMADPNTLQQFALNTSFSGTASSINVSRLDATLDQTKIQGELAVKDFEDPDITFGFGIDAINADRYLPPEEPDAPARPAPTPEAAAAGASTLPLETLRALKVKGDLEIGSLQISGAKMTDVKVSINARDGNINVAPIATRLYGGSYNGRIALDARGAQPVLAINSTLKGVKADPLLVDVTGTSQVGGIASFEAQLTATGGDAELIKRTLAGTARFNVQNGVFRGIDARKVLDQVETMIERKQPVRIDKSGQTPFEQLSGSFTIDKGIISNRDLTLRSPGIKVTGQGMVCHLPADQIKYDVVLAVDETTVENPQDRINLGGYTVPAKCRGSCGSPNCLPDVGKIAGDLLKGEAQDKLKGLLGDKLGIDLGGSRPAPAPAPTQQAAPTQQPRQQQPAQQQQQQPQQRKDPEDELKDALQEKLLKGLFGN